jgi:hypothetical protein
VDTDQQWRLHLWVGHYPRPAGEVVSFYVGVFLGYVVHGVLDLYLNMHRERNRKQAAANEAAWMTLADEERRLRCRMLTGGYNLVDTPTGDDHASDNPPRDPPH